jgi:hypothetical protein
MRMEERNREKEEENRKEYENGREKQREGREHVDCIIFLIVLCYMQLQI